MTDQIIAKLETFFHQYTEVIFKRNDMLINGTNPSGIFFVESGYIRQYNTTVDGNDILLNIYKPHTFFPMYHVITGEDNPYYFQAITEVKAWRAPQEQVVEFLHQNPDILMDLLRRVYIGLDGTLARIEQVIDGSAQNKVIMALLIMGKRFGIHRDDGSVEIDMSVKQDTLASLAGVTKETFSRQLSQLRKKALITSEEKHLVLNDMEGLEEILRS